MEIFGILGLILSMFVLIYLTFKGVAPIPASVVAVLVVAVTNGMGIMDAILNNYVNGLASFVVMSFAVFAIGALYGKVMGDSKATVAVGYKLLDIVGKKHVILVMLILNTVLLYVGINVFVMVFSVYPIMVALCTEGHIPKRLALACIYAGTTTIAPNLPGNASNMNALMSAQLELNMFSAPWWGIACATLVAVPTYIYLQREAKKAIIAGDDFVMGNSPFSSMNVTREGLPNVRISLIPMVVLLSTILIGSVYMPGMHAVILGLSLATLSAFLLFWKRLPKKLAIINEGIASSINPLISVSAIVGFAGVIQASPAFSSIVDFVFSLDVNPIILLALVTMVISIVTANTIGTAAFFMQTLLEKFVQVGVDPGIILRLGTMGAIATTAMPHAGGVVAAFALTGTNHQESYKDTFVVGIIIPTFVMIIMTAVAVVFS